MTEHTAEMPQPPANPVYLKDGSAERAWYGDHTN